ncbi:NTP transferase domain-containing protein [Sphingomonas lenta]|uniref:Nucleotidyl transferase n=1 Tax=Sphingomonas lenta TaxID=1141887 RepID=A0A2A2SFV5_9SPHN|nr:phosphocholine cytidylyltransferase family protein [Sphingomonas lenta]PAX08083.1 nucleotidyl transferase [Sphingomonas lenta]
MRAIIISAGAGTRLLPLTRALPKCLVPVDGRAILDHQLDALAQAGVEAATVVGGYRVEQLASHLRRPTPLPTELVFNPFWSIASSIGSVWAARAHLGEPFVLLNGDTLFDPAILRHAVSGLKPGVSLLVEPVAAPELDDMLAKVADGRLLDVRKDLSPADATHRSLGVVLSAGGDAYRDALADVIGADGGTQAFHHAVVAKLARSGVVHAVTPPPGLRWQEIDRPQDIGAWTRGMPGTAAAL